MSDGSTSEVEALRERVRRLEEALAIARVVPWEWHIAEDRVAPAVDQEVLRPYVEYPEVPANLAGFLTVVHPDDRDSVRASLRATLEEDAPYVACYRLAADRHDMWVEARGVLYRDDAGNPVRLVGIAQDIRERKALEDKVQHSQMIEALGLFAGGLAHDFNNLLTVIRLNTELLASALASKGMVQTVPVSLLDIRQAAERGAELTRQLLAVSRRQFLARTPTDLSRVLDSVISLTRRLVPENIELVLDRPAGECFVLGDPSQFAQVLLNLILNARDAMPEGGSIEVTLGPATLSVQRAAAMGVRAGEHARLRVKDTGVGMDPETMARLFEPFFTTKGVGKGSGLGLATVHGTVALLGGAVEVDSTPGRGSTFDVYLPLTDARPPAAATRPPPGDLAGHAEAILVVDDDEAVRTAV